MKRGERPGNLVLQHWQLPSDQVMGAPTPPPPTHENNELHISSPVDGTPESAKGGAAPEFDPRAAWVLRAAASLA